MKRINLFAAFATAIVALSSVGCSKFEKDVFEEPSALRLENYNDEVKKILTSGNAEWIFEAYPGGDQAYGGYAYVLKFTDEEVTAWFELGEDSKQSYTSRYKMTKDNGPVLSFDTNNTFLHFFATPSSGLYQAYGGDFEFTVMQYNNEEMTLSGKRSGNNYYLRRADESKTPQNYIDGVLEIQDSYRASMLEATIGDLEVSGVVDLDFRRLTLTYLTEDGDDEDTDPDVVETSVAFAFTDYGMRFYEPFQIEGCTIDRLWYLPENNILTNGVVTFKGKLPDDYMAYGEFAGDFVLTYNGTAVNVTLTPEDGGYRMTGLSSKLSVFLSYDKGLGRLRWNSQKVGENGENVLFLCAWALDPVAKTGSLTWNTDAGVTIHWVAENNQFEFEDGGNWKGKVVTSFILWQLDANLKSIGEYTGWGTSRFVYLESLKRR